MIEPCSVNVTDLAIFRRDLSGQGGDGTDVKVASGLRAHHEEGRAGTPGRDVTVTNVLMVDGVDSEGDSIVFRAHDLAQWTDYNGELTDKLAIVKVAPFFEPGRGIRLAHVRLDVG